LRKFIALLALVLIVFVVYNRQRLFVRDPLGSLTRNGVKEHGAQVFINFSNDVLLENDNPPMYVLLVQRGQPVGTPAQLWCLHYVVCLTNADVAALVAGDQLAPATAMSNKTVEFRGAGGRDVVVTLR
jgi:hypothetical protein